MTAKIKKTTKQFLGQIAIGFCFVAAVIGLAFVGSGKKREGNSSIPLIFASSGEPYDVSVDELSELFIMSSVAENHDFSASSAVLSSYYSAKVQYTTNQYSLNSNKIEKPVITDVTGVSKGVITYVVEEDDSISSIITASRIPGLTSDQVRWSNGLKTTDISAGNTLYLPAVAGIVYVAKSSDTPSSLASHYDSDADAICSANYLGDGCSLKEGLRIVLPGGTLPNTERPEYVPPARPTTYKYALRYTSGNPYVAGQCTWFAWQWRHNNMGDNYDLPSNLGNARTWAIRASGSFVVNRTPAYGAVFVNGYGYYGHVGIVTKVDGSTITITDMNGGCGAYCVDTRTIEQSEWSRWNFIHQRIGT